MTSGQSPADKGVRKGLLILAAVAMTFYLGFILLGILQS